MIVEELYELLARLNKLDDAIGTLKKDSRSMSQDFALYVHELTDLTTALYKVELQIINFQNQILIDHFSLNGFLATEAINE